jgi:hypothetical protein
MISGTGTTPSTFQQQIRNFNSSYIDVSVTTRNTLHGMPSLSLLSSTQSELHHSNVNYSGFDVESDLEGSMHDQDDNNHNTTTEPIIEKCTFLRNTIRLPPDIAFQVHLMSTMNEHRGNNLNMYNEVVQCVKAHAVHHNVDFKSLHTLSRMQLVRTLTRYYQLDFLKPTLHSVPLSDGSVATVPIYNVKALILAFLNDPSKMCEENFASNYDIFTEKKSPVFLLMKYTLEHYGNQLDKNIAVMTQMPFPSVLSAFMTRDIQTYLVHLLVHHLFVLFHF